MSAAWGTVSMANGAVQSLRKSDNLGTRTRHWSLTLQVVMLLAATSRSFALSPEAKLEAAVHREVVLGDLKGAIEQYTAVLQETKSRPVSARALLRMGECFEKSGRKNEARAVFTRLLSAYPDQNDFTSEARDHLASIDALPGPPQLSFALGGPGNVPAGWFLPVLQGDMGCPAGSSCAVVLVPKGAPLRVSGDLMQTFSAAAYRGKTVRLRSSVRVEGIDASAQVWLSVDRPKASGDRVNAKPILAGDWTPSSIFVRVDDDANVFNFGIVQTGHGRVSVEDVSIEIDLAK
jgi:hypothetical protein